MPGTPRQQQSGTAAECEQADRDGIEIIQRIT